MPNIENLAELEIVPLPSVAEITPQTTTSSAPVRFFSRHCRWRSVIYTVVACAMDGIQL